MAEQKQKEKDDLLREHKKTEREMIKKGKKPFYIKKCEILLQCLGSLVILSLNSSMTL